MEDKNFEIEVLSRLTKIETKLDDYKSVKDKTYITQTNDGLPFILDVEAIKEYSVE